MLQKSINADPMNQTELINGLAVDLGISNVQSQRLLRATLSEIRSVLIDGQAVSIPHWGTFDTTIHESRRSFLPFGFLPFGKGGYAILPKRRVPVFRTGKELREDVYDLEGNEEGGVK